MTEYQALAVMAGYDPMPEDMTVEEVAQAAHML